MTTTTSDPMTETGGSDLSSAASGVAQEATRTAEATAGRSMDRAADALDQVVQAFRGAQDELRGQQPQIAGIVDTAVRQVDSAAAYLREHEPREVLDRAQSIAREQPALVVGGGLLLGLVLGRVLRSAGGDAGAGQRGYGSDGYGSAGYGRYGGGYGGSGSGSFDDGGTVGAGYGTSYGAQLGSTPRQGVGNVGGGAVGVMDVDRTRGASGPGSDLVDSDPTIDLADETIASGSQSDRV